MSALRIEEGALRVWWHAGLRCAIRGSGMHFVNGYVQVPEGHPAFNVSYSRIGGAVNAHGSLTYADSQGWFGFDTGHSFDVWTLGDLQRAGVTIDDRMRQGVDFQESLRGADQVHATYWTIERLIEETERLATQLAELTEAPEPTSWDITQEELDALRAERDDLRAELAKLKAATS